MLRNTASFRDSSGFVFEDNNNIYRWVSKEYSKEYAHLNSSGLFAKLLEKGWIVNHRETDVKLPGYPDPLVVLQHDFLPVISYPSEWCFSQLKEAALLTLDVLNVSLEHGMILKDGSAYNVQFRGTKPVFIDTLSFALYTEGQPWNGYRQFCEHFLAPLYLYSKVGLDFQPMLGSRIEGVSLALASKLLPWTTLFQPAALMHIHAHAKAISRNGSSERPATQPSISKKNLIALIDHLRSTVSSLKLKGLEKTQWGDYDQQTHYNDVAKASKALIIKDFTSTAGASVIWDVGANDGLYSRAIASDNNIVISMDFDPLAVEKNFRTNATKNINNVYPLIVDAVNPTASIGWANKERPGIALRSKPGLIMALAVIHHLTITCNIPFEAVAEYFSGLAPWLIIEFVPETDDKVKVLPHTSGKDRYNRSNFDEAFGKFYEKENEIAVKATQRSLLLLKRKPGV
ncbi:MAG: class I SAM-dependent methyltransferase [Bacteroidota bacterium]